MPKTEVAAGGTKADNARAATRKAPRAKAPKAGTVKAGAAEDMGGASTSPIALGTIEARFIGDQLRGIAYLAKKLALAIREKNLPTPFDPSSIEEVSQICYGLADDLRPAGDDGSNGG